MNKERLQGAVERLRGELDRLEGLDDPTAQRLGGLADDVAALQQGEQDAAQPDSIVQRLEQEIAGLEASHPSLTLTMAEILEVLTSAGI